MSNTARITISLPRDYERWLKDEAERLNTYVSSIVRLALDQFIQQAPIDVSLLNEARIEAQAELMEAVQRYLQERRD